MGREGKLPDASVEPSSNSATTVRRGWFGTSPRCETRCTPGSIIRCRETGLYYAPHIVGHWTESQAHAMIYESRWAALEEVQFSPHFTTQCWHIVWPGWTPAQERRSFREWLRDAWTSFKHNLFQ